MTRRQDPPLGPTDPVGTRRSRLRIIADILSQAQRPVKKTHIMHECNLSFKQLKHYLRLLMKKGLIRRRADAEVIIYQTTTNGREYLRRYSSVAQLLRLPALRPS
jgi:predicted transcriptional regulator